MDKNEKVITVEDYNNVIEATVTKLVYRYGLRTSEIKDLVQQMWIEVLKKGEQSGETGDLPDLALVPTICEQRIKNIIASNTTEKRGGNVTKVSLDPTLDFISELQDEDSFDKLIDTSFRTSLDKLWAHLDEKEQEYLKFWLEKVDFEDYGIHPPIPKRKDGQTGRILDGYQEKYIAKKLGFPSASSASYRKFRDDFRDKVKKYIGNWKVSKSK